MGLLDKIKDLFGGGASEKDDPRLLEVEGEADEPTGEPRRGQTIEDTYRPDSHDIAPGGGEQIG